MTYARSTQLAHTACVVVSLLFAACSPQRSDDGGEAVDVASGEPLASADALASRDDRLFLPRRIHHTEGNVANPDGLLPGRAGTTTLTAAAGEPEPMIVLDYGRDVGGIPEFLIVAVTGTPRLQAIYSERLDDLRPAGDASYPDGHEVNVSYIGNAGGASLSRVNSFTVAGPGLVRTAMAQGGERYQAIRIAGAGTVTLARVGIRSTHTTVQAMRSGSFLSSDPALNEIWDLGATTVELTRFPAGTLPTTWTIGRDGLRVSGSSYSVYQAGTAWHDYTASFDLHVVRNEASWFVGEPAFGFQFTVAAHDDQLAAPSTIRVTSPFAPGSYAQANLPFVLEPGTWHQITVVNTSTMRVFVDGAQVLEFIAWPGSFGFAGYDDAVGLFRNLRIVDATGATLLASALTDEAALDAFAAGTNRLPVMIDGAKRDRWIWAGDLAVAGPTAFYATGDAAALAGSLTLLGSYQRSDGLVPGTVPPQLVPGLAASGDAMPAVYFYSLSYSLYFVIALYDYYLHTDDTTFLRWAWPIAKRDLAYMARRVDGRHLVVTDDSNQKDWHPHDTARLTGAVAEFNVLYYRALVGAAAIARARARRARRSRDVSEGCGAAPDCDPHDPVRRAHRVVRHQRLCRAGRARRAGRERDGRALRRRAARSAAAHPRDHGGGARYGQRPDGILAGRSSAQPDHQPIRVQLRGGSALRSRRCNGRARSDPQGMGSHAERRAVLDRDRLGGAVPGRCACNCLQRRWYQPESRTRVGIGTDLGALEVRTRRQADRCRVCILAARARARRSRLGDRARTDATRRDRCALVDRALRDPDRVHGTDRNDRERRDSCRWRPGRASHQRPDRDRPARGGRRSGRVAPGVPLCPRARAGEVPGRDRALSRAPCPSLSSPRSPGPAAAPARPMRSASADRCSRRSAHP